MFEIPIFYIVLAHTQPTVNANDRLPIFGVESVAVFALELLLASRVLHGLKPQASLIMADYSAAPHLGAAKETYVLDHRVQFCELFKNIGQADIIFIHDRYPF